MADATGEAREPPLRVAFDRRIELEFHGARITSDGGLLGSGPLKGHGCTVGMRGRGATRSRARLKRP